MLPLTELTAYLDERLAISGIDDTALNGLQVEGRPEVRAAGFAVDFHPELVDRALADGVDFLFVHHGLLWGGLQPIRGISRLMLKPLLAADISLYAAHLPLDLHPELGHNACLARELGLEDLRPFGAGKLQAIGRVGRWAEPLDLGEAAARVRGVMGGPVQVFPYGPNIVQTVAVCAGRAADLAEAAQQAGADLYITGETDHKAFHTIRLCGLNTLFAGHHATERFGPLAVLADLERRFGLPGRFYEYPSPF